MRSAQTQLTIDISEQMIDLLRAKANSLGLSVSQFVKKIITREVAEKKYPKFKASKATIREAKQAMKDYEAGKATVVHDVRAFFKNL